MRIVSHTASNTEIVCALDMGHALVGVDADSDHPPETVAPLAKLGRDLDFDTQAVRNLEPDVVLSSLTVPGHEKVVESLRAAGLPVYVADPVSLDDVFADIRAIAELLEVPERGEQLVADMQTAMPERADPAGPRIAVEWWPKPVIVAAGASWITDLVARAGGRNPWAERTDKSCTVEPEEARTMAPEIVVMSWCGVAEANYRARHVLEREGWGEVPAVRERRVHPITEAHLGRPGPRLVEGYRRIAALVDAVRDPA
ncbi:ABC transporter substrate-binding protein [Algiphilus aromaticivorans]|uniref:ABC transporter substrate-binding protein n=1 Tax=Algiphilus aromaticivorans TaxID=382454 RepID=UPI0005C144EF|nr:helical backbone metal receptor [Algiphilus aromaticivorans]